MAIPKKTRRYFTPSDSEIGVTAAQLRRRGKKRQLEYVIAWFHSRYEDPAMETPYNGQEGGYIYVHGGPYDARDEIGNEFADIISDEVIDLAVDDVESEGIFNWAPTHQHPDRINEEFEYDTDFEPSSATLETVLQRLDEGNIPSYGDDFEKSARTAITQDIEELEAQFPTDPSTHGGIGHNQPPGEMKFTATEIAEIRAALSVTKEQLSQKQPDAVIVAKSATVLRNLVDAAKRQASLATGEFSKSLGSSAGKIVGSTLGIGMVTASVYLISKLTLVIDKVITWLDHVTLPF
jgi:hypothetical protein